MKIFLKSSDSKVKNCQNSQIKISYNKLRDVGESWIAYLEGHAEAECRRTNRKLTRQGKEPSWWKE